MTEPRTVAERYREAATTFTQRVEGVSDWDAPTPVKEWRARDIIDHLVTWLPAMLGESATFTPVPDAADDPVAAWRAFDPQVQAILDGTGDGPVAQTIDQYFTNDVLFHTWDLARSSGQDDRLDPDFVHDSLTGMSAQAEMIRGSGQFGEQQPVPDDATEQEQLFAFLGRDPRWRP